MGKFSKGKNINNELRLNALKEGMAGVTPAVGESFSQAAAICLEDRNHSSGVEMEVKGDYKAFYKIIWDAADDQIRNTWADIQEATEKGACGIAFLLIDKLAEYTVVQRASKGTGIDYWLRKKGEEGAFFQGATVRLEVSGIRSGTQAEINSRTKIKERQVGKSSSTLLPAIIVIVEFSAPCSNMVKR